MPSPNNPKAASRRPSRLSKSFAGHTPGYERIVGSKRFKRYLVRRNPVMHLRHCLETRKPKRRVRAGFLRGLLHFEQAGVSYLISAEELWCCTRPVMRILHERPSSIFILAMEQLQMQVLLSHSFWGYMHGCLAREKTSLLDL